MMNEHIMVLQNMVGRDILVIVHMYVQLLEALDWKFMHEPDMKTNSDSVLEDLNSDGDLTSKQEPSPKSRWQSSLREENEFLRIQAIQNQAEMDTIRKKLEVCLGEKENLERQVDDLKAKFEQYKSQTSEATAEGKEQVDLPSTTDMPVININDQLELKTMVDAIAAASQREAEAHETAIMLEKENDELKMKLKSLLENNSKLIELYEQATAEISSKADNGCYLEKVENLQHQVLELNEENEKLMSLYEKAMQERDDFKRTLSCSGYERVETKGEMICPEKLVEVDAGERDSRIEVVSHEAHGIGESIYVDKPTIFGSDLCLESDVHDEKLSKEENEVDVEASSEMDIEVSNLTEPKLSVALNCAKEKLERVDEQILDAVKTLDSLGCAEKAIVQVDELSREIEVIEQDIQMKRQQFKSLNIMLYEIQERRTLVDKKLSAVKYSLSNLSSSFSYFELREEKARAVVSDLASHLGRKKAELAALQASQKGLENAIKKNQESEVEITKNIAGIKSKLEEENRKREGDKVLFAIDNTQNIDPSPKPLQFSCKATDLLKLEEEKTKLQAEMNLSQEKLGVIRKELRNLNKKMANVESEIQAVGQKIEQGLRLSEEKELALKQVVKEKEMILEFIDNGMLKLEQLIIDLQQCVFEYDLKEAETKALGEELQIDFVKAEELRMARVIAADNKSNFFSSRSCLGMYEKIEGMQNLRASIMETKLLLEGISHAT